MPHPLGSYKPEVIADSSGKFFGNALRFASKLEAQEYVKDLAGRWALVRETRVVTCDDPVTDRWDFESRRAVKIEEAA